MSGKSNLMELRERNIANQRAALEADAAAESSRTSSPTVAGGKVEAVRHITGNTVIQSEDLPYDQKDDRADDRADDRQDDGLTGTPADPSPVRTTVKTARRPADKLSGLSTGSQHRVPDDVRALLKQMSETTMIPVTLKVPTGINEYIDEHIHDQWKEKIKKQDVLKRALLLAIYEIETGTKLLNFDV